MKNDMACAWLGAAGAGLGSARQVQGMGANGAWGNENGSRRDTVWLGKRVARPGLAGPGKGANGANRKHCPRRTWAE